MDVLEALRTGSNQYMSGEELARAAGMSRAAVWKRIEDLRERGYIIDARPHQGYRLLGVPDVPYPQEILAGLQTKVFGRKALFLRETASTNEDAKKLGAEGWPEGTIVAAENQTAGRGRLGRAWMTPPGGLWFSMVTRPALPLSGLGPLTIVAALALSRAVESETGVAPAIKWPNDLVVGGAKLSGILAETSGELDRAVLTIIGVGLNVNQEAGDFPPALRGKAVSLRMILGREVRRVPILRAFLREFEELYLAGMRRGFEDMIGQAAVRSATIGRRVRLTGAGGAAIEGRAVRMDSDGALVIETADGQIRALSGDVEEFAYV